MTQSGNFWIYPHVVQCTLPNGLKGYLFWLYLCTRDFHLSSSVLHETGTFHLKSHMYSHLFHLHNEFKELKFSDLLSFSFIQCDYFQYVKCKVWLNIRSVIWGFHSSEYGRHFVGFALSSMVLGNVLEAVLLPSSQLKLRNCIYYIVAFP